MNKLYLLKNNFKIESFERIVDYYIPITLRAFGYIPSSNDIFYFSFQNKNNFLELTIGDEFGELFRITLIRINQIQFFKQNFEFESILLGRGLPLLAYDEKLQIKRPSSSIPWFEQDKDIILQVANNAVLIIIDQTATVSYLFYKNEMLGVLTDKNFTVVGFVSGFLSEKERNQLIEYANLNSDSTLQETQLFTETNLLTMNNTNNLIKQIVKLRNVNIHELLYWGLERRIIDFNFIIEYAMAVLGDDKLTLKDPFIVELAGITENEKNTVLGLLEKSITSRDYVLVEKGRFYNKIWFYLDVASEMDQLNII